MADAPLSLVEARKKRGDLDPVACLRALLAEIEAGASVPDRLLIVCVSERDGLSVDVRLSGMPSDGSARDAVEALGLLDIARHHVWGCVVTA